MKSNILKKSSLVLIANAGSKGSDESVQTHRLAYGVTEGLKAAKSSTDRSTPILIYGCAPKYTDASAYLGVHLYFNIRMYPYIYGCPCNSEVHPK